MTDIQPDWPDEAEALKRAGYVREMDITQALMGPHEWGYRDPVVGGFSRDDTPFCAAEMIAYFREALSRLQSPALSGEGLGASRDHAQTSGVALENPADEFAYWYKIVRDWSGSAFLSGEPVEHELTAKGQLYSDLCRLGNCLMCWRDAALSSAEQVDRESSRDALNPLPSSEETKRLTAERDEARRERDHYRAEADALVQAGCGDTEGWDALEAELAAARAREEEYADTIMLACDMLGKLAETADIRHVRDILSEKARQALQQQDGSNGR